MNYLTELFSSVALTPHGFCLLWQPGLMALHVVSDAVIGVSYYGIPIALAYFTSRRPDLVFGWMFWLFALFILACGTTHFMEIWTLWHPDYWAQGLLKAVTALASVVTAVALWPLIPKALALPSLDGLRQLNESLSAEVRARNEAAEALHREMVEHQKTEEALRHSQRMEGLGQLTGGVAHDFNNLLMILQGNLHLVKQKLEPAAAKNVEAMEWAITRGESLTRQLLTFARRQNLRPEVVDLRQELPKLVDMLRRSLRGDVTIDLTISSGLNRVMVDPAELELALINVASNARDAMPSGGVLQIDARNEHLAEGDNPEVAGDFISISLRDTGVGIPAEVVDRVFEPFFTTKQTGKGTGLGLSQVYGFARQSGGLAAIKSAPGEGTTVILRLPKAALVGPSRVRSMATRAAAGIEGRTILLVEDNDAVADVATLLLGEFGYEVTRVGSAGEAIAFLDTGEPIDLVFSDIVMPGGMTGVELALHMRQHYPHLPILLTTGYSASAASATGEGFPIMPKPYRPEALRRAIQNVLASRVATA